MPDLCLGVGTETVECAREGSGSKISDPSPPESPDASVSPHQHDCGVLALVCLPRTVPDAPGLFGRDGRGPMRDTEDVVCRLAREESGEFLLELPRRGRVGADDSYVGHGQTVALASDAQNSRSHPMPRSRPCSRAGG